MSAPNGVPPTGQPQPVVRLIQLIPGEDVGILQGGITVNRDATGMVTVSVAIAVARSSPIRGLLVKELQQVVLWQVPAERLLAQFKAAEEADKPKLVE